jgi:histidinol-phosphate aminotransferase
VIISNPNNPTGTYCGVDEIESFLKKFKGLLVVDEAYIDFYGGSSIDLVRDNDNLIVTRSFSKSYSLAGLRIGIAIAGEGVIRGFIKLKDSYNIDRLAIVGARAALQDQKSFTYNCQMVRNNKEYLEDRLQSLGFHVVPSRANFLFVRHESRSSRDIYELLKTRNILVRFFNEQGKSEYLRISIGSMMEIKNLCKNLEAIVGAQ